MDVWVSPRTDSAPSLAQVQCVTVVCHQLLSEVPLLQLVLCCFVSHQCEALRKVWLCLCNLLLGIQKWQDHLPENHQILLIHLTVHSSP